MSQKLEELIVKYLKEREEAENLSPNSIDTYRGHLMRWAKKYSGDITAVNKDDLLAYIGKIHMDGLSIETKKGVIAALRGFLGWAYADGLIKNNPAVFVKYPIQEFKLPEILSLGQVGQIVSEIGQDFKGIRDAAIIMLLFTTGLRVQSIEQVNRDDWTVEKDGDETYFVLKLWVKRRKQVKVYVHPIAYFFCNLYENCPEFQDVDTEAYFINLHNGKALRRGEGARFSKRNISRMIAARAAELGFKDITAHSLRHSCGTYLYEAGMDQKQIKEWLHHAKLATTDIYIHLAKRDKIQGLKHFDAIYQLFPRLAPMVKAFKDVKSST